MSWALYEIHSAQEKKEFSYTTSTFKFNSSLKYERLLRKSSVEIIKISRYCSDYLLLQMCVILCKWNKVEKYAMIRKVILNETIQFKLAAVGVDIILLLWLCFVLYLFLTAEVRFLDNFVSLSIASSLKKLNCVLSKQGNAEVFCRIHQNVTDIE